MRVRTKLHQATAEQWHPGCGMPDVTDVLDGVRPYGVLADPSRYYNPILYAGWWIVRFSDGRVEVLSPTEFERQYERC